MRKTIFKVNSNGTLRFIDISTEKDILIKEFGRVHTDKSLVSRKQCFSEEIALSEANNFVEDKLQEGYFHTTQEAKNKYKLSKDE